MCKIRIVVGITFYIATIQFVANSNEVPTAVATDCTTEYDCDFHGGEICLDKRCICGKDRPIEDSGNCLAQALIDEPCNVDRQCLGDSRCIVGICSCGQESVSMFNPSSKIYYCHPKRQIGNQCNFDAQCPTNAYCSPTAGCLCENGYGASIIAMDPQTGNSNNQRETTTNDMTSSLTITSANSNKETIGCLPKVCKNSRECESEFHECIDEKCMCQAVHFDPTRARCFKYGSTHPATDDSLASNNVTANQSSSNADQTQISTSQTGDLFNFTTIFKDLSENGDRWWLLVLVLVLLLLGLFIILLVFLMILKRTNLWSHYCWLYPHKADVYEPNNSNSAKHDASKSFLGKKNSINNKSFKRKNLDAEDKLMSLGAAVDLESQSNHNDATDSAMPDEKAKFVTSTNTITGGTKIDQQNRHKANLLFDQKEQSITTTTSNSTSSSMLKSTFLTKTMTTSSITGKQPHENSKQNDYQVINFAKEPNGLAGTHEGSFVGTKRPSTSTLV